MSFLNFAVAFLFLFALFSPVKPDDALIRNLCGRTEQAAVCNQCLRSDSSGLRADGRGLAVIAIRCAERDTRQMAQRLLDLLRSTTEPRLRTLVNDCWLSVGFAAGDFAAMAVAVGAGDFAGGRNRMDIVLRNLNSCVAEFHRNPGVPVPSVVSAGTATTNQDCRIVLQILNNI